LVLPLLDHSRALQDYHNLFVTNRQIVTVVRHHKSQSQWDKPKIVPRFLLLQQGLVMASVLGVRAAVLSLMGEGIVGHSH
jgi:hypothetical protein